MSRREESDIPSIARRVELYERRRVGELCDGWEREEGKKLTEIAFSRLGMRSASLMSLGVQSVHCKGRHRLNSVNVSVSRATPSNESREERVLTLNQ